MSCTQFKYITFYTWRALLFTYFVIVIIFTSI